MKIRVKAGGSAPHAPEDHEPSNARYVAGCRHDDCSAAASAARKSARSAARERGALDPSLIPHGTASGYDYWSCRCALCTRSARFGNAAARARARIREGKPLSDFNLAVLAEHGQRKAAAA